MNLYKVQVSISKLSTKSGGVIGIDKNLKCYLNELITKR